MNWQPRLATKHKDEVAEYHLFHSVALLGLIGWFDYKGVWLWVVINLIQTPEALQKDCLCIEGT